MKNSNLHDRRRKLEKVTESESRKDYIHVRARRGQATDSHSLAERVRREKIGKRMKLLQNLVPGCNKVTGKAMMLDEIINYVQSLQRQVEFLSMKLSSSVNNNNTSLDMIPSSSNRFHEELSYNNNNNNLQLQLDPNPPLMDSTSFNTHLPTLTTQFNDPISWQFQMISQEDLESVVGLKVTQQY